MASCVRWRFSAAWRLVCSPTLRMSMTATLWLGLPGGWKAPPAGAGRGLVDAVAGWWSVWRGGFLGDGGAGGGFVDDGLAGRAGGEQCGDGEPVDRPGQAAGLG